MWPSFYFCICRQEDPNPRRAAQAFAERQQTVLRAVEDTTPAALAPREIYADTASQYAQQQSAVDDYLSQHGTSMPSNLPAEEAYPDTDSQFETPSSTSEYMPQTTSAHEALPPGWQCHLDPTYHHPYYTHLPSGRTQWEAPIGDSSFRVSLPPPKRVRSEDSEEVPRVAQQKSTEQALRAKEQECTPTDSFSLLAGYGSDEGSE